MLERHDALRHPDPALVAPCRGHRMAGPSRPATFTDHRMAADRRALGLHARRGAGPALALAAVFILADAFKAVWSAAPVDPAFAVGSGFLCVSTILASYLRVLAVKGERALHDRVVEVVGVYAGLAIVHHELVSLV